MFETEADFAETKMIVQCNGNYAKFKSYKDGFQEGAEFGYNKAKEEMQEKGLALQSDMDRTIEQNLKLKKCNGELAGQKAFLERWFGEAKEIIKKYLAIGVGGKITQNYLDVTKEAEQFLKENE